MKYLKFIYNFSFDFKFLFNSINKGRRMIHVDPILRISLMADAAGAITNGFNESDIVIIIRGI